MAKNKKALSVKRARNIESESARLLKVQAKERSDFETFKKTAEDRERALHAELRAKEVVISSLEKKLEATKAA